MRNRLMFLILPSAFTIVVLPTILIQSAKPSNDFKTSQEGVSRDLMGVWLYDHYHHAIFPEGVMPSFTTWGETRFRAADTLVNDPNLGCLPRGIPRMMMAPYPIEIYQVSGMVLIEQESLNELRHIRMNRQHLKDPDPSYDGDSIGKWEGNTLVVDTIGFNDVTWLDNGGLPHSDQLHVIERIRRIDRETLQDDFTIEDPKAYTKAWTASQDYKLHSDWEIQETTCDHNHYVFHPIQ
jgi:hypothetical protein